MAKKKLIDLYPYCMVDGKPQFLILKRARGKIYENQWRMIGGKAAPQETYWQAALRELQEETGITPKMLWALPSVNQFYESSTDTIHTIPAFAAKIEKQNEIVLDDEHTEYKWIKIGEVEKYILWPEQQRLIRLTDHIITSDQILDDWLIQLN